VITFLMIRFCWEIKKLVIGVSILACTIWSTYSIGSCTGTCTSISIVSYSTFSFVSTISACVISNDLVISTFCFTNTFCDISWFACSSCTTTCSLNCEMCISCTFTSFSSIILGSTSSAIYASFRSCYKFLIVWTFFTFIRWIHEIEFCSITF